MTHQLEVGQSAINRLPASNPRNDFGQYLLEVLKSPNKLISLRIKNLTCISPMYRILSSLNIIIILTILTLTTLSVRTWVYPKYPNRVDGENQLSSSRKISHLTVKRQALTPQSVNEVVSKNLFRKERIEYQPPVSPQPISQLVKVTPRPVLPPPKLSLRGVMLLNGTKIAILEGTYSISRENKIVNTPIKRKGYYLDDQIGSYKITQISKSEVVLNTTTGQVITVKLKNNMTTIDEISKRTQRKPKSTSTRPVTKRRSQPTPRISGSILTPLPKHISGR